MPVLMISTSLMIVTLQWHYACLNWVTVMLKRKIHGFICLVE